MSFIKDIIKNIWKQTKLSLEKPLNALILIPLETLIVVGIKLKILFIEHYFCLFEQTQIYINIYHFN